VLGNGEAEKRRGSLAGAAALAAALLALVAGVWAYDGTRADGATGTWHPLHDARLERSEVGAARIGDAIYVAGGFLGPSGSTTAAVERYDIPTGRWQRLGPMPVAVNHPAVVAYRGFLYAYGGYPDAVSFDPVAGTLQRFDPRSGRWTLLPPSPTPRAAAAPAAGGGRLYAIGGADGPAMATLEIYDIATRRWQAGPPMATPREHLAAVSTRNGIYVLGGRSHGGDEHDTVERFDPRTGKWAVLPPMHTARSGFAAVAVDGHPVAFGGEELRPDGTTIPSVEIFDPAQRRWRLLPPMRDPRHGLGGAVQGSRIYAIEGGPTPGLDFSDAIEFLDVPRAMLR
jgi:hypothetical protein